MLIPSESEYKNISDSLSEASSSEYSDLNMLQKSNPNSALNATTPVNRNQKRLSENATSTSRSVLASKQSAEKQLYVKRGNAKKSHIMEDALNAIKSIAQEDIFPPKMDEFDMLGTYIASKLRRMTSENREHFEKEILKVLSQST